MSDIVKWESLEGKISKTESFIVRAAEGKAIDEIPAPELVEKTGALLKGIARDIGLRSYDQYDAVRFMDILQRYYGQMTLQDIKLAIELAMVGELDAFLPRERGQVNLEHYQQFNLSYVSKILRAYRLYKGQTMLKVAGLLPEAGLTEQEKKDIDQRFYADVIRQFRAYRDDLEEPRFIVTRPVLQFLHKHGLIEAEVEACEVEIKQALAEALASKMTDTQKGKEERIHAEGNLGPVTGKMLGRKMDMKRIRLAFDKLIEADMDIEQLIYGEDSN